METTASIKEEMKTSTDNSLANYELFAGLFIYPEDEACKGKIKDTNLCLLKNLPEAADTMKLFIEFTDACSLNEMQELFLRSFDVQAITTLDIGFILFGEDYKRGQLLVHLNKEHREAGNVCHTELSDHLPNVLRLLPKLKDEAVRNEIATRLLIPAVIKMIGEFSFEKIKEKDVVYKKHQKTILDFSEKYRTVYQALLQALFIALKKDFGYEEPNEDTVTKDKANGFTCGDSSSCSCPADQMNPEIKIGNSSEKDFKQNIETEMMIEK